MEKNIIDQFVAGEATMDDVKRALDNEPKGPEIDWDMIPVCDDLPVRDDLLIKIQAAEMRGKITTEQANEMYNHAVTTFT
ncbi:hypothetical protein CULCOIPH002_11080 [Corynebacterium ulcerans]|uniref:Antitoxin VbhA domain-containing protein n=1 Tax=Corynebacterium ulcerans TaxID=65058 RepID=A0ABD0BE11_CORUL|nr:hypothetical protein [Corynebacterium ulcerans]AEG82745.1 hypothetical protein CULC22_00023 [Corynebacterium ulcerans BR-AD22]GJJ33514.1 hypothetical protein CULCOIPH001_07220 [Corynebacterium ulcerans]GJJ36196.1 hypothetical protein CULCOIPH002_11080 [Corynebacterium ulcerans]GJJ38613.1 hypothetical protein CULCOIPH003_12440 [Corynebacterium ulcerans]GJJ40238.1 hypothetical protein CULCOIPH004_06490 [Corynebacterium ulcerans]